MGPAPASNAKGTSRTSRFFGLDICQQVGRSDHHFCSPQAGRFAVCPYGTKALLRGQAAAQFGQAAACRLKWSCCAWCQRWSGTKPKTLDWCMVGLENKSPKSHKKALPNKAGSGLWKTTGLVKRCTSVGKRVLPILKTARFGPGQFRESKRHFQAALPKKNFRKVLLGFKKP